MTTCLRAWMILNEVSAGKDAEAHPDEGRELISLGLLERAQPPEETGDQGSIDTIRQGLRNLDEKRTALNRIIRTRRGGIFRTHRALYRSDEDYKKAFDELEKVEDQERTLRTRVVNMVQENADREATGAVDGVPVRVTYRGRELMVTLEPRLGRVGGKEVPEFIQEVKDVRRHFEERARRAHEILRKISPKVRFVDEIHLRLASVGLAGSAAEVDQVADLFVRAHKGITTKRPNRKEPAYVSLAEMLALNAKDPQHVGELVKRANELIDARWDRRSMELDEVRASAILLSCGGNVERMVANTMNLARAECQGNLSAGALLACAMKEGDGEAKLMEFQSIRHVVAAHSKDQFQAMTASALLAAAGLDLSLIHI